MAPQLTLQAILAANTSFGRMGEGAVSGQAMSR